jgi:hypothetical protein
MAKQPYIPFYIGDYIKDTRRLPLAVRGAWVDLLLFMWDEPVKGEITGTIEEFSGMLSCSMPDCKFALDLLIEKKVCNYEKLPSEKIKIISRRMKKDAEISLKRSESGKLGAFAKTNGKQPEKNAKNLPQAKDKQNPEYVYDIENDIENTSLGGAGTFSFDLKTKLPPLAQESAEMNQITHTKKPNREFVKSQWVVFLGERMNDPPEKKFQYRQVSDLSRYFLNWIRNKFPTNGSHIKNAGGKPIPEVIPSGGRGKL